MAQAGNLNILHVLRAPVGGLFRHVVDLAHGQAAREHRVGLITDSTTGGAQAEAVLAALGRELALGLSRVPMSRQIGTGDWSASRHVARRAAEAGAHVIHGHGAKGGAFARLAHAGNAIRVYTPHGGSLHYRWRSPTGLFYLAAERALSGRTDLFLFESAFGRDTFNAKIGPPADSLIRVVHNGVTEADFLPVIADPGATDLLFVGELRMLKGVDVLIAALNLLLREGRKVTATIAGDGPDRAEFEHEVAKQSLDGAVRFIGPKPARQAFALGRVLVVPSRAESLPYIVLEAAAAQMPLIATNVGGIPEIVSGVDMPLIPPGDVPALAGQLRAFLAGPKPFLERAAALQKIVGDRFTVENMTHEIIEFYISDVGAGVA